MGKYLKILFLVAGPEILPSSRTRVYHYLAYLKEANIRYKIIRYATKKQSQEILGLISLGIADRISSKLYNVAATLRVIFSAARFDVIFIQKILLPRTLFATIRRLNKNIVFDFDDALYTVKNYIARLNATLALSRYVIVENVYNERYAKQFNRNALLLATPVDVQKYCPKHENGTNNKVVIGWIGTPSTTFYLKPLYNVFKRLSDMYPNVIIQLVGSSRPKIEGVSLVLKDWYYDTEREVLQNFNIGIMPLCDDEMARGRGCYKLLLYMAVGIPFVASSVGVNKELIKEGHNGFLANNSEEWIEKLSLLIENTDLRLRMGREGRRIVERSYSYEKSTEKLVSVLKSAADTEYEKGFYG